MQKLKITQIYTTDKDRTTGAPLIGKNGRPYTRMSIKAEEYGDAYISGFKGKQNEGWKVGDIVEAIVEKNVKGDKEYLNFSLPKIQDTNIADIAHIKNLITGLGLRMSVIEDKLGIKSVSDYKNIDVSGIDYPDEQINAEDIPF